MKRKRLFQFALLIGAGFLLTIQPAVLQAGEQGWEYLVAEAKKEGKVTIYGSATGDTSGELTKAFKKKYGIDLEFLTGRGNEIFEKLLRERRAGLYLSDAAIGGASPFFSITGLKDIAVPLAPLLALEEVKDPTKWRAGKISFLDDKKALIALVADPSNYVAINVDLVKEGEIKSFQDLLAPKWKGKIVLNDPSINGRGLSWFVFMLEHYGGEGGLQYAKQLALQGPMVSRNGRLQVEWLAKGKYPVGLGLKPTMVTSFKQLGAPIKFIVVKEGGPLSSGSLNLYAFDKAPHPSATKVFINWLLTKEAGELIQRTSGYASERVDVSKKGLDPTTIPGPKDRIKDSTLRGQEELRNMAAQVFLRGSK